MTCVSNGNVGTAIPVSDGEISIFTPPTFVRIRRTLNRRDTYSATSSQSRDGARIRLPWLLLMPDTAAVDPWLFAQSSSDTADDPLVAVQPIYMHRLFVAKLSPDRLSPGGWGFGGRRIARRHGGRRLFAMILSPGRSDRNTTTVYLRFD